MTLSTAVTGGDAQSVTLRASGLPAGATATFTPATIQSGNSVTLTIATTAYVPGDHLTHNRRLLTVTENGNRRTASPTPRGGFRRSTGPAGVAFPLESVQANGKRAW